MCQQCAFGYHGDDCSRKKPPLIRRNALTLSPEERAHIVQVFDKTKNTPSDYAALENGFGLDNPKFVNLSVYDFMVHLHYFATKNTEINGVPNCINPTEVFSGQTRILDFGHNGPGFLTWHRLYLLYMEREMGQVAGDPDFALPYWRWAGEGTGCSVCTDDLAGSTNWSDPHFTLNSGSPFSKWTATCQILAESGDCDVYPCNLAQPRDPIIRHPGGSASSSLPTRSDVIFTLSQVNFDEEPFTPASPITSFRNCLEGFGGLNGRYAETHQATMHVQVGTLDFVMSFFQTDQSLLLLM